MSISLRMYVSQHKRSPLPGTRVYIVRSDSWETRYHAGVVVKVTPSGMVDVLLDHQIADLTTLTPATNSDGKPHEPNRFYNTGIEGGVDLGRRNGMLEFDLEEVERQAEARKTAVDAANALNAVHAASMVNPVWSKHIMEQEVVRLQELLDKARFLVDSLLEAVIIND